MSTDDAEARLRTALNERARSAATPPGLLEAARRRNRRQRTRRGGLAAVVVGCFIAGATVWSQQEGEGARVVTAPATTVVPEPAGDPNTLIVFPPIPAPIGALTDVVHVPVLDKGAPPVRDNPRDV